MNIDSLRTLTNSQPLGQAGALEAGWFAQLVENWRVSLAVQHADLVGEDDELRDLGPSRHAIEREIGKAVWYG